MNRAVFKRSFVRSVANTRLKHENEDIISPNTGKTEQSEKPSEEAKKPFYEEPYDATKPLKNWKKSLIPFLLCTPLAAYYFLRDEEDEKPKRETWMERISRRYGSLVSYYKDPPSNKLLPDPLPAQYQKPLTLVINLEKFLVTYIFDVRTLQFINSRNVEIFGE
jgi:hypothetical protein